MCAGCFVRATVKDTSPVPPAISSTSSVSSMGAWRIMPASHALYAPKLETALNRSYFLAMLLKISFTRSDEISAGASFPVAVSMLTLCCSFQNAANSLFRLHAKVKSKVQVFAARAQLRFAGTGIAMRADQRSASAPPGVLTARDDAACPACGHRARRRVPLLLSGRLRSGGRGAPCVRLLRPSSAPAADRASRYRAELRE